MTILRCVVDLFERLLSSQRGYATHFTSGPLDGIEVLAVAAKLKALGTISPVVRVEDDMLDQLKLNSPIKAK